MRIQKESASEFFQRGNGWECSESDLKKEKKTETTK